MRRKDFQIMNIFYWFLIIAAAALLANLLVITVMYHKKAVYILPIAGIVIFSFLLAALLYLTTVMHGTELLDKKPAATLEIEPQSFQSAVDSNDTIYAFCSTEGVEFHLYGAQLLDPFVPEQPAVVEIYYCTTRDGFSWCSLGEGAEIRYILK